MNDEILIDPKAGDAAMAAYLAFDLFSAAVGPVLTAQRLASLSDAMNDLASWLPGYNSDTGMIDGS